MQHIQQSGFYLLLLKLIEGALTHFWFDSKCTFGLVISKV